jgi:hypothetical protein
MKVFLDTEFTQLRHPKKETKLISIGLVTEDGERSFYVELTDNYNISDCSDFVVESVLPLLDAPALPEKLVYKNVYAKMTKAQCREQLACWIAAIQDYIEINSDAPSYDWPLFTDLFHGHAWPIMLFQECRNCYPSSINESRYLAAEEQLYSGKTYRRHHALDDAKVMMICNKLTQASGAVTKMDKAAITAFVKKLGETYHFDDPRWNDD